MSFDNQKSAVGDCLPLSLLDARPDDEIGDAGFLLQRDGHDIRNIKGVDD